MNINVRPVAAEQWADNDFVDAHMSQRENGDLVLENSWMKLSDINYAGTC